ncbi:50S ribosomal protein L11 methyltransferase [uncultured Thermanaerothrix sp.]|uniref:50S ribosomal protein L11 methyltransferase n=1 Tax=uncultured Thermanaerothrix sp. TaxID=1195149 RepID=UPI00260C8F8E|nr:50S ribosomal protein L11 methyltransferase [uncultured Thermanaerothrix sp.]
MAEPRWLEVSLTVDEELAEVVAEVLARFTVQGGVAMEQAVSYDAYEIEGQPIGPVRVFGYLVADEMLEETRQRLEEALWHLSQIQPLPAPIYRWIEDQDWMAAWKQHYHPLPIGKRLLVAPSWAEVEVAERVVVRIDPSMAFGTGTHPSTQLSLELLERYVQPGQEVIDVGCGSGILSIAAVKLGARQALAVDIDPASVRATNENARLNDVAEQIEVGQGSVREILQGRFRIRQAPLVMANILAPVIKALLETGLTDLLTPEGVLILSGLLQEQAPAIEQDAIARGLSPLEQRTSGDWAALALRKHS